jgi:hypothetical protein
MNLIRIFALGALCSTVQAQTAQATPTVRAVGTATINSTPDQATVDFSVVTQATTAQGAASQNATITNTVLTALQQVLGANANIHTLNYSLSPVYSSPPNGGQGTLIGFSVSNTVEAVVSSLALVGQVIDAGTQGGASRVQGLTFGLRDPEPVRQQALQQAAIVARAHAVAMTAGAGLHAGSVIDIVEGAATTPVSTPVAGTAAAATTPIEPGTVTITATVTVDFAIVP